MTASKRYRKETCIGILICLSVIAMWFSPWWIGGRNLAPLDVLNQMMEPWRGASNPTSVKNHIVSDAVDQYLVYRMVAAESYRTEGWLGWSSLTYGGTAQYANTMALYYDWTMQLHRWFDFWTAWHLGLMGQVMLAGAGMLLFLRGRSIGIILACCGAIAYAANSQFVVWIYHRWALGAFCWVPWILWAIDNHRKGKRGAWMQVPVFIAMAFLGGTLQHGIYVILAVAAAWGEQAFLAGRQIKAQARTLGRFFVWGVLGTGLAAMMFIPCVDAFIRSTKLGLHMGMHGTAAMGLYPKGILQPLLNLAAYPLQIFPSIVGRSETVDLLKPFKSELFYIAYFGSLPVLIAFIALFRKQTPVIARILIGTGLILPLTPVLRHLYQRLYLLFILGGILAFVHFVQNASAETKRLLCRVILWLGGLAVTCWTLASVLIKLKEDTVREFLQRKIVDPSGGSSFGHFRGWMQGRADKFMGDIFIWSPQQLIPLALFALGVAGLWLGARKNKPSYQRGALVIAAVVLMELTLFGSRWVIFVDPVQAPLFPATAESEILKEKAGNGRVATMDSAGSHMAVTPFIPNTLSAYGIATIHGYDSIMPDGMFLITNAERSPGYLGQRGVSHLITFPGNTKVDPDWKSIWQSPSMELFENPTPVPRYTGFPDDAAKDSFFQTTVSGVLPTLKETTGKENTREIMVPAGTKWIRVADNQAEGWQYQLATGTEWKNIQRAPDATMLMENPNPEQEVTLRMRYDPPVRRAGFIVSALSAILVIGGGIVTGRHPSKASESAA